ncbi:hypothetical protein AB0873_14810 [Micromonospora sp. NPDC047707]|uniref:hypothetical protein n=1 Tax=Micromonospora sp. NPDC047707 TaxID=3154498 RepID=UPI0034524910
MEPMPNPDAESPKADVVRLRVDVYDALARQRGLDTVAKQAERHGIGRTHMSLLRNGHKGAGLALAMRMAADLGTSVEVLFGRVACTPATSRSESAA